MIMLAAAVMAQAVVSSPPPPPTLAPPSNPVPSVSTYVPQLIDYEAGEARCDGRAVTPLTTARPLTQVRSLNSNAPRAMTVRFSLDADGRPLGIVAVPETGRAFSFVPTDDIAPAFSLWRFPAGRAATGCEMTFTPRTQPVAQAAEADIFRVATLRPRGDSAAARLLGQLRRIDCGGKRPPQILVRAYPDKRDLPRRVGEPGYSVVRFDIDAAGVPVRPEIATSSGNGALDAAALDAAARTRYAGGDPRQGCTLPALLGPDNVPARASPQARDLRPVDAPVPSRCMAAAACILLPRSIPPSRDRGLGDRLLRPRPVGRDRQFQGAGERTC
ncbi:MAG: hypothetical protein CVT77_13315 [Alphaproteobacteria bacterium HGW-Alphaproteobacteria-16]|nr:MAG: hypothetical protein CVT77_13315 [Alphaproteobacteria bacterium HGW-Alphaproteobacteria-16]